uniref:Uncharacterized protein n=1 Tax=Oncorhynchus tshawytscha TaxID=74940 RepID=A0AAZ3RZW4_ONCTS
MSVTTLNSVYQHLDIGVVIGLTEESSIVQSLKEEFTQSIADTERKAQLACKERDIAKKEIKGMREELSTRLRRSSERRRSRSTDCLRRVRSCPSSSCNTPTSSRSCV